MLHIFRIALTNARPNFGLNAIGKSDELKEEEQSIFLFLEQLGWLLIHEPKLSLIEYFSFLMNFLTYNHSEPHFETFIRKSLSILSEVILSGAFDSGTLYEIIPPLFAKVKDIIDLRYNNEAAM